MTTKNLVGLTESEQIQVSEIMEIYPMLKLTKDMKNLDLEKIMDIFCNQITEYVKENENIEVKKLTWTFYGYDAPEDDTLVFGIEEGEDGDPCLFDDIDDIIAYFSE